MNATTKQAAKRQFVVSSQFNAVRMFADGVPGLSVQHSGSIAGEIDGREFRIVAEVPGGRRFETLWSCKAENMTPEQVGRAAAFVRAYRLGRKSALVSGE